jgi:hypothetical protein
VDGWVDLGEGELGGEMIGKRFGKDSGFEKGLARIKPRAIDSGGGDGPIGVAVGEVRFLFFLHRNLYGFGGAKLLFEDGVGLEFSLEKILEFEGGGLEKLKGLLDLGRDRERLSEARLERQRHRGIFRLGFL